MEEIKSTVEHLQDLIDAREDMKTSINNKGVQVSGGLKSYADAIDRIPQNVVVGTGDVEYTTNGSYTIDAKDYSVDALRSVDVTVNVPHGGGGDYEIDFTRIGYSLEESKIANEANVICINNAINDLDTWSEEYTDYNNWSFVNSYEPDAGETLSRVSPWAGNDSVIITPPIYNLNSDGKLIKPSSRDVGGIFAEATALRYISPLDTSKMTDMSYMFEDCTSLAAIPQLDASNVTSMYYMFNYCYSLSTIPLLDTSNVTDMGHMFYNCHSLTTIPQLNTSNVTDMMNMFYGCHSLTTIPQLNTSNVTDMINMFVFCYSLTTIPLLDVSNVTRMGSMFYNCHSLENVGGFKGLKVDLDLSTSPKLTLDSFENIVNNMSTVTEERTLTVNETALVNWDEEDTDRLTNLVEILTGKGWMLWI